MNNQFLFTKKLAIFDLDGTIGKLEVDWISARKEAREFLKKSHNLLLEENLRLDEIEEICINKLGKNPLISIREKYESSSKLSKSRIYEKTTNFIEQLDKQGVILTICSNNLSKTCRTFLETNDLLKYFKLVIGSDSVAKPKPAIDGSNLILKKFSISPEDCFFVGDSIVDKKTADRLKVFYLDVSELS